MRRPGGRIHVEQMGPGVIPAHLAHALGDIGGIDPDRIVVIDNAGVVEAGSHGELLDRGGASA